MVIDRRSARGDASPMGKACGGGRCALRRRALCKLRGNPIRLQDPSDRPQGAAPRPAASSSARRGRRDEQLFQAARARSRVAEVEVVDNVSRAARAMSIFSSRCAHRQGQREYAGAPWAMKDWSHPSAPRVQSQAGRPDLHGSHRACHCLPGPA